MEYNLKELVVSMWEHRKNKDFERKSLMTSYRGLSVKASIGMTGVISRIPWISYCAEGQETQRGIYPVLLFYGTPEFQQKNKNQIKVKKIVLAYGVSANKKPDILWGAEVDNKKTIEDAFEEWNYNTSDAGIKKYNTSYVYKIYEWTDDVNYNQIQNDIDQIIDIYLKILFGSKKHDENGNKNQEKERERLIEKKSNVQDFSNFLPLQIIYYGAPGTGKSHIIKKKENEGLRCIRTTFHPDSDYATFVGCYKPHCDRDTGHLTYEFVEQAFMEAYVEAWKNPKQEIALVIEEINRGNCAQIFGDIFQLLDRDDDGWSTYPIKADTDICEHMENLAITGYGEMMVKRYGDGKSGYSYMALPPNMSILATMNTSDQSLFPIDSAFKRRWDWQYMPIANGNKGWRISAKGNEYDWWEFLVKINALIGEKTNSEDKKLGYYFCKAKDGVIDAKMFVGKVIFYLWNDVFKDYEFEGDAFNDVEGKLTFDKFYKTIDGTTSVVEEKVVLFFKNLGVVPVAESEDEDIEDDIDDEQDSSSTSRDQSKYSINGEGSYKKGPLAREVISKYLTSHEEMSVDDALRLFNSWRLTVPHFVESQQQFDQRTAASNDVNKRSVMVTWGDNNILYVTTQWNLSTITDFVNAVNREDWGIRIEKL